MISIKQRFGYSIRWNFLESVWYQLFLFSHQCTLYKTISAKQYGKIGTAFSLVYLAINLSNFGLDRSISPFFGTASQSRSLAYHIIMQPIIWQTGVLLTIAFLFCTGLYILQNHPWCSNMPFELGLLIGCMFITEELKKTVRTVLHCAFKHNITTAIELCTVVSYIIMVWSSYYAGYPLDLQLVLIPMVITSAVSLCFLLYHLNAWYQSLPLIEDEGVVTVPTARILHHRLGAYVSQLATLFFSANFLVPLFAWKCGLAYAALFKLISHFNNIVYMIIHKIFGASLQACFALMRQEENEMRSDFFGTATNYVYQLLYGIIIIAVINGTRFLALKKMNADSDILSIGYLFFISLLVENFFVSYEQLYQAEEKTAYLNLLNGANVIALLLFGMSSLSAHPIAFLLFFVAARLCALGLIGLHAYHQWRIPLQYSPQPITAISAILISLFLFFITI